MTYTSENRGATRITTYPERGKNGEDLRIIVGPINAAIAVRDTQLKTTPLARVRYERIDRGLDQAYFEIELPLEEDT
jgi:hypothetical protein